MKPRRWTRHEASYLRRWAGRRTHAEIGAALGRSPAAVQSYAARHGLTSRRHWDSGELALLADLYPTTTAREIARRLGRTAKSIHQAATAHGAGKMPRRTTGGAAHARLLALNRSGATDTEIAAELGCTREAVTKRRRRLGLPSNARGERYRARVRARTREQCAAAGVASLAEVRSLAFRRFAAGRGWPDGLPPRAVMILDALEAYGPMTRRQIADAIGMPWKGARHSLTGNCAGGSYLALLARMGLVARLGRRVKGRGKGRSINLYTLSLTAGREGAG